MHTRVHVLRAVGPCTHVCVRTASRTSLHTCEHMYKCASKPDPFLSAPWARQEHAAWLFPTHTRALGPAAFPYSHPNPMGPLGRERHWGGPAGLSPQQAPAAAHVGPPRRVKTLIISNFYYFLKSCWRCQRKLPAANCHFTFFFPLTFWGRGSIPVLIPPLRFPPLSPSSPLRVCVCM